MQSDFRTGVKRLAGLLVRRPESIERDADDEIDAVLDGRIEYLMARGMTREDARAEALRRIGGSLEGARRRVRKSARRREGAMSIREWIDGFTGDLRYAVRGIGRDPLFSTFAVLTLALGIGANAAMFGVVDKLLLRGPEHVRDASHVVRLFWTQRQAAGNEITMGAFDPRAYANLVAESHAFTGLAMYTNARKTALLGAGSDARLVPQATATSNLMSVLGARPELGRFFTLDEQRLDSPSHVVVLGYGLWQSDFAGSRDVVGKSVTIGSRPYTVVGVAPRGFTGAELDRVDLWTPLPMKTGAAARHWGPGSSSGPGIVARLAPNVSLAQATTDATESYRRSYDGTDKTFAEASISVGPLRFGPNGKESTEASISRWLGGLSAIVLLVACTNIVNLLLARAVRRRREMAVRIALGAGRARLLRLLLASSLVLALLGGVASLAIAFACGTLVRRVLLPDVDWTSGPIDARVLWFALLISVVTGIAMGLLPALRAGRADVSSALKTGAREGGGSRSLVRNALMIAQAALAMLLLVGAGLFVRSLDRVRHLDFGVQPERVVELSPRWPRLPENATAEQRAREDQHRNAFAAEVLKRVAAAPGVEHAAAAIGMPFGNTLGVSLRVPGLDSLPRLKGGFAYPDISAVSADYFATMGTRLLEGRVFTAADRAGSERVAIVSQTMARVLWPNHTALGQCIIIGDSKPAPTECTQVVGIVQDARRGRIREDPSMHYYVPIGQQLVESDPDLIVRPRGDAASAIPSLRALMRQLDPSITFVNAMVLQDRVEPQTRSWRIGAMMFSLFAGLALVVAAIGVFSVVAYLVEQRRHEIGVRIALGAQGGHIVALMLRGAVGTTVVGVVIGALVAAGAGRFVEPLLFDTSARDPMVIGGVAVVLTLASILASGLPALRARRVDPVRALRDE